jgi:hypothetical protein
MLKIVELLKKTSFIVAYKAIPYYIGKNWSKFEKYKNIPLTLHK